MKGGNGGQKVEYEEKLEGRKEPGKEKFKRRKKESRKRKTDAGMKGGKKE